MKSPLGPRLSCDVAIIGAGTAGLAAYDAATAAGAKVLLIERGRGGTMCARVGCMPSKLLIAAANAAHGARQAARFGVKAQDVAIDGRAVMERVQRERDNFVSGVLKKYDGYPASDKAQGAARFVDATTLAIADGPTIEAKSIIIATGSRPVVPNSLHAVQDRVLTTDTIFERDNLPSSIAVVGAGPIGVELAQALARLGVRTALFGNSDHIGGLSDPAVAAAAHHALKRELPIRLNTTVKAQRSTEGVDLAWTSTTGESGRETFEYVLAATGRTPNLDDLDLKRSGLDLDRHGVPVFDPATLRCGKSRTFITGDAEHRRAVLHEAAAQGTVAGRNAANSQAGAKDDFAALSIVFTEPGLASVGRRLKDLDPNDIAIGAADYGDQGRARINGETGGLLRVYARCGDGLLLGAEMAAPGAEHLAHLLAWGIQLGHSAKQLLNLPFYHPTLEEGLRTALRDACEKLDLTPRESEQGMPYGPSI